MMFALNTIKRRSVIIVISDFIDDGYEHHFKALARRHDLIAIHVRDRRETALPNLGIVPIKDQESGQTIWMNATFGGLSEKLANVYLERSEAVHTLCRKHQINYLPLDTQEDFVPALLRLFKIRNRSFKL